MAKVIPIDGIDSKDKIRLPGPTDRITLIGHTGSGKSHAALWHLSNSNFNIMPWIISDPKNDEKIEAIPGIEHIKVGYIPKHPGIYAVHPSQYENESYDEYCYTILRRGRIGTYFDEAFMCGQGPGFTTLLIQGRSQHCPAIILTQRPVFVSRFAFSEAQFFQCFSLTDDRDYKTLQGFAKVPNMQRYPLPEYNSYYYDVRWKRDYRMLPVPDIDSILDTIDEKMATRKQARRL